MTTVYIKLINMSITASWLILAVILLRIIMKNAPKWSRCILWGLVAVRLICPISVESIFSLLPSAETIPQDILYVEKPTIHTGVMAINSVVNPYISERMAPGVGDSVNPMQVVMSLGTVIWLVGMIGMLVYAVVSFLRIKNKADVSLAVGENVFLCDYIDTPFVLGIVRPKIFLPSALAKDDKVDFVIAHEKAHIRRLDHWWKPLGFMLLTIYWFNPMIWIAYIFLCRDIELACDEYVISSLKEKEKKTYSDALLACSMKSSGFYRNLISACPLAFGEVGVKDRVKAVLNYKKSTFYMIALAVVSCIVVAFCFLTNPVDKEVDETGSTNPDETIVYNGKEYKKSELCNATLHWLELSEHERIASSYLPPELMIFEENWGVTLTIDHITPTSASIVCTQSGGVATGELQTGNWYIIENWTQENGWKEVDRVLQEDLAWTMEAWGIQKNSKSEWKVNWEWLYGELLPGKYRIGKEIMDFRKSGDFDTSIYYADFVIDADEDSSKQIENPE